MTKHEFEFISLLNRLSPCVDWNKRTIHKFNEIYINDGAQVQFQPIIQKGSLGKFEHEQVTIMLR